MSCAMSEAVCVRDGPRRVLRGLLLDTDGAIVRRRRDERILDCPSRVARVFGADHFHGPPDRSPCWYRPYRRGRVVVLNGHVLITRTSGRSVTHSCFTLCARRKEFRSPRLREQDEAYS